MVLLSNTGPSISPWGTPLQTNLQLEVLWLITILWAWQISQFWGHLVVHLSSLFFSVCPWRTFERQCLKKFETDNIHLLLNYFSVLNLKYKNIWNAKGESIIKYHELRCMTFLCSLQHRVCFGIVQLALLVCKKFAWLQQMKNIA